MTWQDSNRLSNRSETLRLDLRSSLKMQGLMMLLLVLLALAQLALCNPTVGTERAVGWVGTRQT